MSKLLEFVTKRAFSLFRHRKVWPRPVALSAVHCNRRHRLAAALLFNRRPFTALSGSNFPSFASCFVRNVSDASRETQREIPLLATTAELADCDERGRDLRSDEVVEFIR